MNRTKVLSGLLAAALIGVPALSPSPALAAGGPNLAAGKPATASSTNANFVAANVTDGNPDTYWHTNYGLTLAKYPHVLEFDLVDAGTLTGFTLLPRQDGNSNGRIKNYEFSISDDRKSWKPVKSGAFPDNGNLQKVKFDQAVKGRYVRFSAVSEQHDQDFASAAEIGFLSE